jgi:hypothetical protein
MRSIHKVCVCVRIRGVVLRHVKHNPGNLASSTRSQHPTQSAAALKGMFYTLMCALQILKFPSPNTVSAAIGDVLATSV